jgi:hypothetical protein
MPAIFPARLARLTVARGVALSAEALQRPRPRRTAVGHKATSIDSAIDLAAMAATRCMLRKVASFQAAPD